MPLRIGVLIFLVLNGIWVWIRFALRLPRIVVRAFWVTCWTAACIALYVLLLAPADRNAAEESTRRIGLLDDWYWPYAGSSKTTVSLTPAVPIYTRLTIEEDAAANRLGYHGGSFRPSRGQSGLTKLTYTIELDPVAGAKREPAGAAKNQMIVDALNGLSWHYATEQGVQRRGALLDASVVAEWLRNVPQAQTVSEEQVRIHSSAIVDLIRAAADENGESPVLWLPNRKNASRLHYAVYSGQRKDFTPGIGLPRAFQHFSAADNLKWEPFVPIVYVGLPLILGIWGMGLWLLLRNRSVRKIKSGTRTGAPLPAALVDHTGPLPTSGLPRSLWALQLFACFLGLIAGLLPNFSQAVPFWGFSHAIADNEPLIVSEVASGSPADQAGLRRGDSFQGDYFVVKKRLNSLEAGEKQMFAVNRDGRQIQVELIGGPPDLIGIWYADIGYPIAGAVFLCIGLLIFATASLKPIPLWRPMLTAAIGLGTAIGFFLALHGDTIYSSFSLLRSGTAPYLASTTTFHQGFLGIAAGVFLLMLAAAEVRHRILNPGPRRKERSKSTERIAMTEGDHTGPLPTSEDPFEQLVIDQWYPGRKIAAIRAYREMTGADLAEAKAAVERIAEKYRLPGRKSKLKLSNVLAVIGVGVLFVLIALSPFFVGAAAAWTLSVGMMLVGLCSAVSFVAVAEIWREWWLSPSPFLWKLVRTGLLLLCLMCVWSLLSWNATTSNAGLRFRIGNPSPWFRYSTVPAGEFVIDLVTWSTPILVVGWLALWAYRQSFVEQKP